MLALALIITGSWALGGFGKRTDLLSDVAPGTTVTTGPYTFTFTEVTAQRTTNYKDEVVWKLIAIGTGSSADDRTGAPDYDDTGSFVSRDDTSQEVQNPSGIAFGENGALGQHAFTPGLPPVRFTVVFDYSDSYQPQSTLRFVVLDLEKRDTSLLGDGEEDWHSTGFGYSYQLPVRVLPEKTS